MSFGWWHCVWQNKLDIKGFSFIKIIFRIFKLAKSLLSVSRKPGNSNDQGAGRFRRQMSAAR